MSPIRYLVRSTAAIALVLAGCDSDSPAPTRPPVPAPAPPPPAAAPAPVAPPIAPPPAHAARPVAPSPAAHTWDFDRDCSGWTPWGTSKQSPAELARVVSRATAGPHSGAGCLMVSDDLATANLYAATDPGIPAAPGQTWLLSAWIRSATADQPRPALAVAAESDDAAKPMLGWVAHVEVAASTSWKMVQLPIPDLPAGTTHLRLAIHPVTSANVSTTATVFVDDVRLVPQSQQPLDLGAVFNRSLSDQTADDGIGGWTDQGDNDMRGLKAGPLQIGGMTFTIADPERAVIGISANRPGFAASAVLPLGTTCDHLHLLHTAAWAGGGAAVGTLVWRYADGGESASPLTSGDEVGDWWNGNAAKAASKALRGVNPRQNVVYLFATTFDNPQPDRTVAKVELRSAPGQAIWLVLAASISTGSDPLVGATLSERDRSSWPAFRPAPSLPAKPLVDLSGMLDLPAGKHGFVRSADGHLLFADGRRARFWGTNIHSCFGIFPTHEQSERIAATLARYGFNLVRLHLPDSGLVDTTRADRQTMVGPEQLDRFDYLVKCLADHGVYILVDAVSGMSARKLGSADGIEDGYSAHRPGAYFIPRLRELADDWSRKLLTRRNLHTGRALVDEPAVALVLIQNEQSVFFDWGAGKSPIPAVYRQMLEHDFAAWLHRRYQDRGRLAAAWGDELRREDDLDGGIQLAPLGEINLGAASGFAGPKGQRRSRDTVAFLQDLQMDFDRGFTAHLRTLGVKVPIIGTNLLFSPAEIYAQQVNDMTCHNAYYEHVKITSDGRLQFANQPQPLLDLLMGDRDLETSVASARLAGKAHGSTETDTMFPMEWRSTYGLSIAATSAHQDWDAVMHYCYMGGWGYTWDTAETAKGVLQPTVEFDDPALIGLIPAASLLYLRGDVAASPAHVQVVYSDDERTATRPAIGQGAFPYGYLAHVCRVDAAFGTPQGGPAAVVGAVPGGMRGVGWPSGDALSATRDLDRKLKEWGVIARDRGLQGDSMVSDTGEIVRDWGRGIIRVNTARSQGASGFLGGAPLRLQDVEIGLPHGGFATVMVSSLDNLPIASSRRILITTVGRAENDDQRMAYGEIATAPDGSRYGVRLTVTRAKEPGQIRIEPVRARIVLPGRAASITPLAADLQAGGATRQAAAIGADRLELTLGDQASAWYLVEIDH